MALQQSSDAPTHRVADDPTGPPADAQAVRDVIAGSHEALATLYDRHGDAVFSAAMRASGDRWIAAEVVQETFLALWDRAEQFDPDRGALAAWLVTIARHRAIDRLRAAGRHDRAVSFSSLARTESDDRTLADRLTATGALIGAARPEPAPEHVVVDNETRAGIQAAIAGLDPMERHVIVLAYDGGLSQSEIAASLGWPIGTVKTRTRRALRHLRERLDGLDRPTAQPLMASTGATLDPSGLVRSVPGRPSVGGRPCLAPC